jgi:hypothetical protein
MPRSVLGHKHLAYLGCELFSTLKQVMQVTCQQELSVNYRAVDTYSGRNLLCTPLLQQSPHQITPFDTLVTQQYQGQYVGQLQVKPDQINNGQWCI